MERKRRVVAIIAWLFMAVFCIFGLTACIVDEECSHQWDEWKTTIEATCTKDGFQTSLCTLCGSVRTADIEALGHEWGSVSCTEPKTCTRCEYTEDATGEHTYDKEVVTPDALKSEATCTSGPVYYKSCSCGEISDTETFVSGEALAHTYDKEIATTNALKSAATCQNAAVYYKSCDCGAISDTDTFISGRPGAHTYDKELVIPEAIKSEATCTSGTTYYKSCDCGEISDTETFAVGDPTSHSHTLEVVSSETLKSPATCSSAAVYYKSCSCGALSETDTFTSGVALAHSYGEHVDPDYLKTGATCTTLAVYYKSCSCGVISETETFTTGTTTSHSYIFEVVTHDALVSNPTCTSAAVYHKSCICGAISEDLTFTVGVALGHNHMQVSSTEATCENPATATYLCQRQECDDQYTENIGTALGHSIIGVEPTKQYIKDCEYVLVYICSRSDCEEKVEGNHVSNHNYVASITTPATCESDGQKTLTCSTCQHTITEVISKDSTGHSWVKGTEENGVRTDTCSVCEETKRVTVYQGTATHTNNLKDTEIELDDVNIILDEGVINTIGEKKVTISAEKLTVADLANLVSLKDKLEQIGNNPIYNFTISDGESNISQFGENNWATIIVPYTLTDGEDVDSIAVWFITDDGQLESIEATYNNGYITFKTNHFSYYTVTRLTPTERCELYGHNYATHVEEGSCTTDGYTLHVCVRCHNSYVDGIQVAEGHNYQEIPHPATCTENGHIEYQCSHCQHRYQTTIKATGHDWEELEKVSSTCSVNGHTEYKCSICEQTYTETYGTVEHKLTSTVTSPTCESTGYTLFECEHCEYSYIGTYVDALGHDYQITPWQWESDYSSAIVSFVCEHDESHIVTLIANISTVVTNGACSDFTRTTHTAAVTYNGQIYTDSKVVEVGTPEHAFGTTWERNDEEHWHECTCGEKTDVAEHSFRNKTITKAPTCGVAGESVSYCSCGATKVEVIPATKEHSFVDGECEVCGAEEILCDHSQLHQEIFDLSEYGCCEGTWPYLTCECGETIIYDFDNAELTCDMDNDSEEFEEYVDEEGYDVQEIKSTCSECGLEAITIYRQKRVGCDVHQSQSYTLIKDGVTIVDNAYTENTYESHEAGYQTVDATRYGFCGGTIRGKVCINCRKITDIEEVNTTCNVDFDTLPETEEVVIEGVAHQIGQIECPECHSKFVLDSWDEKVSTCKTINHSVGKFYGGTDLFFERDNETHNSNHEYQETIEMHGATCDDGYTVTKYCPKCEDEVTYDGHGHDSEEFRISLEERGLCGGYINYTECIICKQINVSYIQIHCHTSSTEQTTVVDGITHYISEVKCPKCGLVLVSDSWQDTISECETMSYQNTKVYAGETLIFECTQESLMETHQYQETYKMNGQTCKDGYTVSKYCPTCKKEETFEYFEHRDSEREIKLRELELCDGVIYERYCLVCDEIISVDVHEECDWEKNIDENGNEVYYCNQCGTTKTMTISYGQKDEECLSLCNIVAIYTRDDEELYRYEYSRTVELHNFEVSYQLFGDSCTDEYLIKSTCLDCKDEETRRGYDHNSYLLFELGTIENCCSEHSITVRGCLCGYELNIDLSNSNLQYNEEESTYICSKCSLTAFDRTFETTEGCSVTYSRVVSIKLDNDDLYNYTNETVSTHHNFNVVGVTQGDEVSTYSSVCNKCHLEKNIEVISVTHSENVTHYQYYFTPEVSGTYVMSPVSQKIYGIEVRTNSDNEWISYERDQDGRVSAYLTSGKEYIYEFDFGYDWDEENKLYFTLMQESSSEIICNHGETVDFSILADGSNCENGVIIGKVYPHCGCIRNIRMEKEHSLVEQYSFELEFQNMRTKLAYMTCACKEQHDVQLMVTGGGYYFESSSNEYYDEEGRLIYVITWTDYNDTRCTCTYYIVEDSENCKETYYYTFTASNGEKVLFNEQRVEQVVKHDYQTTSELINGANSTCEDGIIITKSCKNCSQTSSHETYYHEEYEKEVIELSKLGSVCGGYAIVSGCGCGKVTSLSLKHMLCDLSKYEDITTVEGAIENVSQKTMAALHGTQYGDSYYYNYICAVTDPIESACGYKIRCTVYWMADESDCHAYLYQKWQFGYDEEKGTCAYEITFRTGEFRVYHNYQETQINDEENNLTGVEYDCKNCESYYHSYSSYVDGNTYEEIEAKHTLDDNNDRYYQRIYESRGRTSRVYSKIINYMNEEYWNETLKVTEDYDGPFGENGYKVTESFSSTNEGNRVTEQAYVYYKGHKYLIYDHLTAGEDWHNRDYTYTFEGECRKTLVYTDSDELMHTESYNCCNTQFKKMQDPTCTQDGIYINICDVCELQHGEEHFQPSDHHWIPTSDGMHYQCERCGLENENGSSGSIVLEDLTATYGNNENYVAGYWARNDVKFTLYVSLVTSEGEVSLDEIQFIEIDDIRAVAFNKTQVETLASDYGFTDSSQYQVKLSFVPYGDDGSFDYAIIF